MRSAKWGVIGLCLVAAGLAAVYVMADVPTRTPPIGIVPNPGTQEQELPNITSPGIHNIFEFPQFCGGCHGSEIDHQVSHYPNWSGTNMANSGRDPFFRANNLIVNYDASQHPAGINGGGNICWRCHSPNGWYAGRLDEALGGRIDGTTLQQSLLASTDMQGIMCEFCHRTLGNVTQMRADLDPADPAWNQLATLTDWPHAGLPYPEGPVAGLPYGDTTFMIGDGKAYQADMPGNYELWYSDVPVTGTYTGQTYGVYPDTWTDPIPAPPAGLPDLNPVWQAIFYNPDGKTRTHLSIPVGPPVDPLDPVIVLYADQSVSPRHDTHFNGFMVTSEMCGTCHDLTVPVFNHGMPEQRTYTEWKFSTYGDPASPNFTICQDCHMGEFAHDLNDTTPGTFKCDPNQAGFWPHAKVNAVSALHKWPGANRDLPAMLKLMYPDVDLEIAGTTTGRDTRVRFPSNRDLAYSQHVNRTQLQLRDAVSVAVTAAPAQVAAGVYETTVRVTNNSGHAIPSGYPDGRRFFVITKVTDANGALVYESGYYDQATATLYDDSTMTTVTRAQAPLIDASAGSNAVMIYEKRTGTVNPDGVTYTISMSLLNDTIIFDNRLRPAGFDNAQLSTAGVRLVSFTGTPTTAVPFNDPTRYPNGQNWDDIVYRFNVPAGAALPLQVTSTVYNQTHHREFVEYLKDRNATLPDPGPRPEKQPNIFDPDYPVARNYISDTLNLSSLVDLNGQPLQDNWGGVMYAAWLLTGKGAPFACATDTTTVAAAPVAPVLTAVPADAFSIQLNWTGDATADGYIVWERYTTVEDPLVPEAWDRIAFVEAPATSFLVDGVKVGKTYGFKVVAVNGKGLSAESNVVNTLTNADIPQAPENLKITGATDTTVTMTFSDVAANETGFILERQDIPATSNQLIPDYAQVAVLPANAGTGTVTVTDSTVVSGMIYNYRVRANNANGVSLPNTNGPRPVTAAPATPTHFRVVRVGTNFVRLFWVDRSSNEAGFVIERAAAPGGPWAVVGTTAANANGFIDNTVASATTYYYRVAAVAADGTKSAYTAAAMATTR